jgi:RNA polymerase sigma-70 factor (ECF subfamily)
MSQLTPKRRPLQAMRNTTATERLRAAADDLGRGSTACFKPKAAVERTPEGDRIISLAVARAKHGDADALRYLYLRFSDNVYGYVRSIVRDEHEAEDVTQHVFAKLMVVLPKYEERESPFTAWILRVARNVAVDFMRQRRAIPCEEVRDADPLTDEDFAERGIALREALDELPEGQREVVVLRHVVGLSPGEIAERLGKTEPCIHGLHHRGRGALRAALAERGVSPAVAA